MKKSPILLLTFSLPLWAGIAFAAPSAMSMGDDPAAQCSEGFEDVESLFTDRGWLRVNRSTEATTWTQALEAGRGSRWEQKIDYAASNREGLFFNARAGSPHSVIFTSLYAHEVLELPDDYVTTSGVLSNWLITPEISFSPGMSLSFWTRKGFYDYAPIWSSKPDRLVVRACTSGDCTNVGNGPNEVGNFTTTLLTINPDLGMENDPAGLLGYPYNVWQKFTLGELPPSGSGRIAFQYHVPEAMDVFGAFFQLGNGNMIALDEVTLEGAAQCPLQLPNELFADGFETGATPSPIIETISQNGDTTTIEYGLVFNCVDPSAFLRRFDLDGEFGLGGRIDIGSVEFGIERSYSVVPVEVRLHTIPNDADLLYANLTQIGSGSITAVPDDRLALKTVATPATVADASTHDLVVELRKNETHRELYLGFNPSMQTAPSYAAFDGTNCGNHFEPTNMENVAGAPDAALLLNVNLVTPVR